MSPKLNGLPLADIYLFEPGSPWPAVLAISLTLLAIGIPLLVNLYGDEISLWWKRSRGHFRENESGRQPCVQCGGTCNVRPYPYWIAREKPGFGEYAGVQNAHGWVCDSCATARKARDDEKTPKRSRRWALWLLLALGGLGLPVMVHLLGGGDELSRESTITAKTGPFVMTHHLPSGLAMVVFGACGAAAAYVVFLIGNAVLRSKKPGAKIVLAYQGAAFREQGYRFGGQGWLTQVSGTDRWNGSEEFSAFTFQTLPNGWDLLENYKQIAISSSEPVPSQPRPVAVSEELLSFACSHCGKRLKGTPKLRGKTVACPRCKRAVTVPV